MGQKEEIVYETLGLPFPADYFERCENLDLDSPSSLDNVLRASGYDMTNRDNELLELLNKENRVFVGSVIPRDIEKAVISVMNAYVKLTNEAVNFALKNYDLTEREKQALKYKLFVTYAEYIESFSKDEYLILKHWKPQNAPIRADFIANFSPTIQGYFSFLESRNLKISAFFLRKLKIVIPEEERKRHTYICSKTGSGKSELLKILVYSYLKKPDYCTTVIIEPHGDLCEEIAHFKEVLSLPDFVYIDPTLYDDLTPSINPFEIKDKSERNIDAVSQALTGVFDELLKSTNLSLQMETILIPCISTLLRMENATIKDLQTFMDDDRNGGLVNKGKQSPNDAHREFFKNGFFNKSYASTKQSIYTKIQSLLNSQGFADFIARPSTFDLEEKLNSKGLILFNLSKGKMGDDTSEASGRFIVAMIQSIIKRRAWEHKSQRVPVHLFIDECQNYVSPSIETVLTELRKYGLHLTLANQFIGQNMDTQFKNALLSSTNIKFIGLNNSNSLSILAKETGADVGELQKLKTGEFYLKCGERPPFKIHIPSFLTGRKNSMSAEDWKDILREQRGQYYQPKQPPKERQLKEEIDAGKQPTIPTSSSTLKPKFDL